MNGRQSAALAFLLTLRAAVPAAAEDNAVDLELVLAVDISRSMDLDEQQLQRQGYVAAFRDPAVIGAIRSGLRGRDELGRLSRAFDAMALEVAATQTRLKQDIAERMRAAEALRVSEASYRAIFDAAEDAIFVNDFNTGAIVDVNALQADGPTKGVLRTEPVTAKWEAFGWHAVRVDGNDIEALVAAFDHLREHRGSPAVLICDTRIGCGVPMLEMLEKAHFMRVEEHEWQLAREQLTERHHATAQKEGTAR